jgi:FKBP-type peptidyl-prolyl cis-trans isomerase FklB
LCLEFNHSNGNTSGISTTTDMNTCSIINIEGDNLMTKTTSNTGIKKIAIAVVIGLTAISATWALTKKNTNSNTAATQQTASTAVDMNQFSYVIGYKAGMAMTKQLKEKVDIQQYTKNLTAAFNHTVTQPASKTKINEIAFNMGMQLHAAIPKLILNQFTLGLQTAYNKQPSKYTAAQTETVIKAYTERRMGIIEAQMKVNKKASDAYMAKIAKQPGVKKLQNGLYYKVIKQGNGSIPKATDTVKVDYTGWLINNTQFDSSKNRGPAEFKVNGVIPGWTAALEKMPQGSEWKIYIAPELAYGVMAPPSIGPEQALIFDVNLREIKKTA